MGLRLGIGFSCLPNPFEAARAAAREAKKAVPEPGLAIAYGSIQYDQAELHQGLVSELDPAVLMGGSSYAEVSNLGVTRRSVVVLAISIEGVEFRKLFSDQGSTSGETGKMIARQVARASKRDPGTTLPLAFLCGAVNGDFQEDAFLSEIRRERPELAVYGGLAATNYDLGMGHPDFWKSYQYIGKEPVQKGVQLTLCDLPKEDFSAAFAFEHGWLPIGPVVELTRTEVNKVFEVDGLPIFDYFRQFLGDQESQSFFELMIQRFAFSLIRGGEEDSRSLLKLPVKCNAEEGYIQYTPCEDLEGKKVRLIQATRNALAEGARRAAERCKESLGKRPSLIYMVSCCTRSAILHSRCDTEIEAVQEVFGKDVPIFGYYSGGEFAPLKNRYEDVARPGHPLSGTRFHAGTVCLMALATESQPVVASIPTKTDHPPKEREEIQDLQRMLGTSEDVLDDIERFMASLSRKSYRDGEVLKERNQQLQIKNEHNEKLQSVVHRYTPHDIWGKLGDNVAKGVYELDNDDGNFTFLFMDVKGFTSYSEKHDAAEVVEALNQIFKPATDIIYELGGDVDKYIGDCIFAAFARAEKAVEAAVRIQREAVARDESSPFSIRIGINAGRAIRANVGSSHRREYTYIGDSVNLAQRLESNCTPGHVLIAEDVFNAIAEPSGSFEKKVIEVKGKAEPITTYQLAP